MSVFNTHRLKIARNLSLTSLILLHFLFLLISLYMVVRKIMITSLCKKFDLCRESHTILECISPTPLPQEICGTRSIFKRIKVGLNLEFSSLRLVA